MTVDIEFVLKGITIVTGIVVMIGILLLLSTFRMTKQLRKARLFLHFDKLERFINMAAVLLFVVVAFHNIVYVIFLSEPGWFTLAPGKFLPYGVYVLAIDWVAFYFFVTIYLMLKGTK